jgi:hypothetical protein
MPLHPKFVYPFPFLHLAQSNFLKRLGDQTTELRPYIRRLNKFKPALWHGLDMCWLNCLTLSPSICSRTSIYIYIYCTAVINVVWCRIFTIRLHARVIYRIWWSTNASNDTPNLESDIQTTTTLVIINASRQQPPIMMSLMARSAGPLKVSTRNGIRTNNGKIAVVVAKHQRLNKACRFIPN